VWRSNDDGTTIATNVEEAVKATKDNGGKQDKKNKKDKKDKNGKKDEKEQNTKKANTIKEDKTTAKTKTNKTKLGSIKRLNKKRKAGGDVGGGAVGNGGGAPGVNGGGAGGNGGGAVVNNGNGGAAPGRMRVSLYIQIHNHTNSFTTRLQNCKRVVNEFETEF
jgi:hypothetical protein